MPERLHPGVYVEEVKPAVRAIEGVSTSTAAFIGVAERGPVNRATLVTSFAEYRRIFGGYRPDSFLTYSVQNFFNNGGKKSYIVRVVGAHSATANIVLRDRERVELGAGATEDILSDLLPTAIAEPVLTVEASSPGQWGNLLDIEIQDGTRDPDNEFKIVVKAQDEVMETWDNLSLVLGDENYVENLLGGDQSQYIRARRIGTATSDTPGFLISGVLDALAQDLTIVPGNPVLAITLSGTTVNKIPLTKGTNNTGDKVAAEIQAKVRAAAPPGASADVTRAFTDFQCAFVPGINARYVLVSGSDAAPRTIDIPPAATSGSDTDVRIWLRLAPTPGVFVGGGSPQTDVTGVTGNALLAITLSGATVDPVPLTKAGKNDGVKIAAEIQAKVRAAVPGGATPEVARAFQQFFCIFVPGPQARYVLVSGSGGIAVPAVAAPAADTDLRPLLKLDVPGPDSGQAALTAPGKVLQRGTSRSGNEPATVTDGNRNLSFNLNRDGFQTVQLDSGLNGGDAVAANIRDKVRGIQAQRKDPPNQDAYANFLATYTARYELTFGDVPGNAGTFTFLASANAPKDWSTDARLRLRAATVGSETTYGGSTVGPLAVTSGLTPRLRTIVSGSASGTRPVADLSGISDGELRLQVTPPAAAAINLDIILAGAGPGTGEAVAAAIQAAVRAKATDPALAAFPNAQAALTGFTARYVAYYTLASGAVRSTDAAGNPAGPLSSVEVLPSLSGDIAPALKLGLVNGGVERNGAALLRPAPGAYHIGDNTPGGPVYSVTPGADGDKPADRDYVGDGVSTGLNALDKITDVNLIAIPGIGSKPVVSAGFGYSANRPLLDCFFIADLGGAPDTDANMFRADVPFVTDVTGARDYVRGLPTKNDFGAIYFPWLTASDPIGKGKNPTRVLPPSGYVAGMYARIDSLRGVFKAPAGTEANLSGALDLAAKIGDIEQDFLNPIGVNVIRSFPASGIVIWGARTLSSDSAWRYVPVRRTAIFLRVSIYNGIQFAVFEPNDDDLWASLRLTIGAFMLTQFRAGAFQGTKPDDAFFVKCDGTTTTQADIDNGVVNILVGFAPLKPAEFVVLKLSQKAGQTQS